MKDFLASLTPSARIKLAVWSGVGFLLMILFVSTYVDGQRHRTHDVTAATFETAATPEEPAAPDPTDPPTAKPDFHAQRAVANDWYIKIVNATALAHSAAEVSGDLIEQGQSADASSLLKKASESADTAYNDAMNPPDGIDGWGDISENFAEASKSLKDAIDKLRDGLDDGKPSTFSDAKESLGSAVNQYADAVHQARVKYESMGGKWSDLPDGQDEEKNIAALLRAAGEASSQ